MRSPREIKFRLRQEAANVLLAHSSPDLNLTADTPLPRLPDPAAVADAVRDSKYAHDLVQTVDEILQRRVPIFDQWVNSGPKIAWRRDAKRALKPSLIFPSDLTQNRKTKPF